MTFRLRKVSYLFKNKDYLKEGQKSEPEWGLNISKKNLHLLEKYKARDILGKLAECDHAPLRKLDQKLEK